MPERSPDRTPAPGLAADVLRAAGSGLVATLPMSAVMLGMHRALPGERHRALPPVIVTLEAARPTGLTERLDETGRGLLATAGHFGYGAAAGGLYALFERAVPLPPAWRGAAFGLAVWAGSYLGWIPSVGLMRPATRQPWERNAVMIAAHLVWGAVLALTAERARAAGPRPQSERGIAPPR